MQTPTAKTPTPLQTPQMPIRSQRERERESKSRTPHNEALTTQNPTTQHSLSSHTSLKSYKKLDYETLSDDEKSEGYIFHILTDKISENTRQKLKNLAKNLSEIYPCEIKIHICDDSIFDGLPKFKGNYLAWFRIFIRNYVSNAQDFLVFFARHSLVNFVCLKVRTI